MTAHDDPASIGLPAGWPAPGARAPKLLCTLVGFAAVVGQIVLMRELLGVFNGNELSLGVMLAVWLFWTAAGSAVWRRAFERMIRLRALAAIGISLWGLSLPGALWMIRGAHRWFTPIAGEVLGPLPMLLISAGCTSVFCLLSGSMFALASCLLARAAERDAGTAAASAYLLETIGGAVGGLFTSLVLLHIFGSFQIAMAVLSIDLCAAWMLTVPWRMVWRIAAVPIAFLLFLLLAYRVAPPLELLSTQRQWPGFRIVHTQGSLYGRILVTEAGGMRSIFENGANLANIPDQLSAEEAVHLALLEHPEPKTILLLGGGMNGSIAEALRHPSLERLDYIELDPALPIVYYHLFPAEAHKSFADPRVHAFSGDGRAFLTASRETYDVILVHVPDPDTAQWNRFYTLEFFRTAQKHLRPNGIFALQIRGYAEAISPHMAALIRCMHHTLRAVFAHVVTISGDPLHVVAADQNVLTVDAAVLADRLRKRNLHTVYMRASFLQLRMSPDRIAQLDALLQDEKRPVINRDFHPQAYYFGIAVWNSQFRSYAARALEFLAQPSFAWVMLSLGILLAAGCGRTLWRTSPLHRMRVAAIASLLATGFALMTLQILILLAFQSLCGYLFQELALLIGMLMGGISLGAWLGLRRVQRGDARALNKLSAWNQLAVMLCAPAFLLAAHLLAQLQLPAEHPRIVESIFAVLALLSGVPGGLQFPIAAEIGRRAREDRPISAGTYYAVDLFGGCAGAILLTGFVIPLYGFWNTAWLASAMMLAPMVLAASSARRGQSSASHGPAHLQTQRR